MTNLKPSEVDLVFPHFVGCCGKSEAEYALGLYVRACQVNGDTWKPMIPRDIGEVLKADRIANMEPFAKLSSNPFWFPNFHELVNRGFARWIGKGKGSPIELTDSGFEAIDKWVSIVGKV